MKELRGQKALAYATKTGIGPCVDYIFLAQRETEKQGHPVSPNDIDRFIEEAINEEVEHGEACVPGTPEYEFLINRYGNQWIFVPLEGNHPEAEEAAVLRSFERFREVERVAGGDSLAIHDRYPPQFEDTGFSDTAGAELFFHAALRLSQKGSLTAVPDNECYGNTAFYLGDK